MPELTTAKSLKNNGYMHLKKRLQDKNQNAKSNGEKMHDSTKAAKRKAPTTKSKDSKLSKLITRCASGGVMFMLFSYIIYQGHLAVAGTMIMLQILTFRELVNLRYKKTKEKHMPYFRSLQWLWFSVAMFFAHGSSWLKAPMGVDKHIFSNYIEQYLLSNTSIQNHMAFFELFSFGLFSVAFMLSVLSLRKDLYDYQITQFTWTLMCLVILVLQMKTLVYNIYNGLFWFVFPFLTVVANDVGAYFAGITLGGKIFTYKVANPNIYRPITFLKLSPKKTWEGFIGAMFFTIAFGYYGSQYLGRMKHLGCTYQESRHGINDVCRNDQLFQDEIKYHGVAMAVFASVVAPFGGFWASAIKRACNIKDFDHLIPGHGGFMDRMDCQLIMVSFVYLYYATFIARPSFLTHDNHSLDAIYDLALGNLSPTEQCLLAQKLNSGTSSNIQNCMSIP